MPWTECCLAISVNEIGPYWRNQTPNAELFYRTFTHTMMVHTRRIVFIFGLLLSVTYSEEAAVQGQEAPRVRWEENVQDTE